MLFLRQLKTQFLPTFLQSFRAYFFVYLASFLLSILLLLKQRSLSFIQTPMLETSFYTIFVLLAFQLFIKNKKLSILTHGFIAFCFVGLLYTSLYLFHGSTLLILPALLLCLLTAPFLQVKQTDAHFTRFSINFFTLTLFSFLACSILVLGLSAIVYSIEHLFSLKFYEKIYVDISILCFVFIYTAFIVMNLELCYTKELFLKPLRFFLHTILIPLLLLYLFILYLYFAKITLFLELPKGNLSTLISIYATLGFSSFLISKLLSVHKNGLINFFQKHFFLSLLLPIVFLYLAIGVRIYEYGLTQARLVLLVFASWLSLTTFVMLFKKEFALHKSLAPLAMLLLFFSLTPFNTTALAANSQTKRFLHFLKKHHLLKENTIVPALHDVKKEVLKKAQSFEYYFSKNSYALKKIEPYFKPLLEQEKMQNLRYNIVHLLKLHSKKALNNKVHNIHFSAQMPNAKNFSYVASVKLHKDITKELFYINKTKQPLFLTLTKNTLLIKMNHKTLSFDIMTYLNKLQKNNTTNFLEQKAVLLQENIKIDITYVKLKNNTLTTLDFYILLRE